MVYLWAIFKDLHLQYKPIEPLTGLGQHIVGCLFKPQQLVSKQKYIVKVILCKETEEFYCTFNVCMIFNCYMK